MQLFLAIVILLVVGLYVVPNIVRYPWHTLVFVVAGVALSVAAGGYGRLIARLNASAHPAARRLAAAHAALSGLVNGIPPYDKARWWLARALVRAVYYAFILALALAVLVALGGVFVWLDQP